jgi:CelD/BcsL family acetyltransferase involved in cellulose biosynthesis
MSGPETSVRTYWGYSAFMRLRPQWQRLFDSAHEPLPFLRHRWLQLSWKQTKWPFPSRPLTIIVEEDGEPVMGGAFVLTRRRLTPTIRFLAPATPQYQDVLYRKSESTPEHAALIVDALQDISLARVFRVGGWLRDSPLRQAMAGLDSKRRGKAESSAIDLTRYASFADFMKRSSNLAHDHKRQLRHFVDLPGSAFTLETGAARTEALRWLFATKTRWAQERDKDADWLYDGSNERFTIAALSGEKAQPAWVGTLRSDGRIIAAVLAFCEAGVLYGSKLAFDPEFAKLSPARTLVLLMLERAFAEGYHRFDLMIGPQSWKSRLADIQRPTLAERIQLR